MRRHELTNEKEPLSRPLHPTDSSGVEREGAGQKWFEINMALVDEVHRKPEFLMEPERALHLDFLGNHHVLRNGNITTQPKLHNG